MDNLPPLYFELTSANLRDLQELRHMEKVCFPQDAWPLIDLIAVLSMPGVVRIKAVHHSRMIGFVVGDIRRRGEEAWISTLSVLPEWRRRGVAAALLDECELRLAASTVMLTVRESNLAAQSLYFRRGYQQTGVWEQYYSGGENGVVLTKRTK